MSGNDIGNAAALRYAMSVPDSSTLCRVASPDPPPPHVFPPVQVVLTAGTDAGTAAVVPSWRGTILAGYRVGGVPCWRG
eukprot:2388514-Rhodomonas_salina.1